MTIEEVVSGTVDLECRPYVIFLHPDDAERLKRASPDIEKSIVIYSTPYVEKGKGYWLRRKDLEIWMEAKLK